MSRLLLALAALLLTAHVSFAQPVEVSHPVAPFLQRLGEKGAIDPGFWKTLPRGKDEVLKALRQADARKEALPEWDRLRLDRYLEEFDPVRRRAGTRLRYADSSFDLVGSVEYHTGIYWRDSLPGPEAFADGGLMPGVEGTYRDKIYFTASGSINMERSWRARFSGHYDPLRGLPYGSSHNEAVSKSGTWDASRAVVGYGDGGLRIEAGQDWNQWGPGHWQHATLGSHPYFWVSDSLAPSQPGSETGFPGNAATFMAARRGYRYPGEGPPLPQIRLRIGGTNWQYVKVIAQRTGLEKDSVARLVAHRLEVRMGNFTLGGTEMLATSRPLDGLLLVPGIPLKIAEHDGGDRDNAMMSGDIEWRWGRGTAYGEFALDDYGGPPWDYWVNKFAWTVGGSWQDPFGIPAELRAEYARVNPFVYAHYMRNTQMQSYGALLGSALPPNSQAVFASAGFPLPRNIEGLVEWRFRQHDFKSRGSSIFDDYAVDSPPRKAQFLAQDVETRNEVTASAEWPWRRYVNLRAGLGGLWVSNWKGEAGTSLATPTAYGEVRLKY
ncbi:MAG TPA: hypothetical protein VHO02_06420 [Fibrobacteria bacterium]|nr:hypothetical protein [Fibrobacteria bacterium]